MFLHILKKAHSGIGIVILFTILLIILYLVVRYVMKKPFDKNNKIAALIGLALVHLQIILGLVLYLISPLGVSNFSGTAMKDDISRLYILEHPVGMIVAAVLITIGYLATNNDRLSDVRKYSRVLFLYAIAYSFILYSTPWFVWA